jgi:hypothetical protein
MTMSAVLAFLFEWRFVIAVIVAIGLYALFAWSSFKAKAYAIMLQAKSLAKDAILKSGQEQESWVVERLYRFLPKVFSLIPEAILRKCVHYLFIKGKDYLDDGQLNGSVE